MADKENEADWHLAFRNMGSAIHTGVSLVREDPVRVARYAFLIAMVSAGSIGANAYNQRSATESKTEAAARAASEEEARQAAATTLEADFETTGGVDLQRLSASFLVTPRGNSRLAQSEAVLINNAWERIRRESGCQPSETLSFPEVPGLHSWDPAATPRTYLIRINCDSPTLKP